MNKTGIPTTYKSYRFRSRLEAKWARFFDLLNWEWEYEPFDLNGWIPDFALIGHKGNSPGQERFRRDSPVLVEIKPILTFDQEVADKISKAGRDYELLLLGLAPKFTGSLYTDGPTLGWLAELWQQDGHPNQHGWGEALIREWGPDERESGRALLIGFCHSELSYSDRMTGNYDGSNIDGEPRLVRDYVQSIWAEAQNTTQWNPN